MWFNVLLQVMHVVEICNI